MLKNRVAVLLGLIFLLSLTATSASAATRTATIHIEGMHCKMCSASVTKALKATDGVEKVEVSFEKGVAVVQYDDQKVTETKLREVINGTGFKVVEEKTASNTVAN
ncbi:MAG: mercuric transport protein periplasmic component [Acidobacteria bacterium]|nr:MAG: mercuric transport protein periplasmic component [Acidobacteriota bacterium]